MKINRKPFSLFAAMLFIGAASALAVAQTSLPLPRASQKAGVSQIVGVTEIKIVYSRPGVKNRKLFGVRSAQGASSNGMMNQPANANEPLEAYGKVWRTGANEATTFSVSDDVLINGQKLAAGNYSLHTIPNENEWTIIFNKTANQWGSFDYDEKQDALRVKVKPQQAAFQEWMMFEIPEVTDKSANVVLRWERLAIPFRVEVPDVTALTLSKARQAITSAKPDDWSTLLQAARFAFENKVAMDEAARWIDQSIRIQETGGNLWLKARMTAAAGNRQEAVRLGERAMTVARQRDPKADLSSWEKTIAEWKK